jgi:hypothetical protein
MQTFQTPTSRGPFVCVAGPGPQNKANVRIKLSNGNATKTALSALSLTHDLLRSGLRRSLDSRASCWGQLKRDRARPPSLKDSFRAWRPCRENCNQHTYVQGLDLSRVLSLWCDVVHGTDGNCANPFGFFFSFHRRRYKRSHKNKLVTERKHFHPLSFVHLQAIIADQYQVENASCSRSRTV